MPVIRPYPSIGTDGATRPIPGGLTGGSAPPSAFGPSFLPQVQQVSGVPRDLQAAGAALEQGSDALTKLTLEIQQDVNDTRVRELNNQFIEQQQGILNTSDNAFYKQTGAAAINAAGPTTDALKQVRTDLLGQTANSYQRQKLGEMLDYHMADAGRGIGRHVATQTLVWQDAVAKGTVQNSANKMVLSAEDPTIVNGLSQGLWQTEYDRAFKQTGSPEAAKASADGVRSNAFKATISTLAVNNPAAAQRMLDNASSKGWIDATDAPALAAVVKEHALKRKAQDITGVVSGAPGGETYPTGGVNPNNIGNVRPVGSSTGFQQPPTFDDGVALAVKTVRSYPAAFNDGKPMTLQQIGARWAPKGDGANDPNQWAKNVAAGSGLPVDQPIDFNDPANAQKFARGVNIAEHGKEMPLEAYAPGVQKASAGTVPQKPNLEAMLSAANVLLGPNPDPDLRDQTYAKVKTEYATKHAIYTGQVGAAEKLAFAHIDSGGTVADLPPQVRSVLDSDGLTKVQAYEEKRLEKVRKAKADAASKDLTDLELQGQLTTDDVTKQRDNLPDKEYRSWMRTAQGNERLEDPQSYERLQRGLGTRDMRDDIFAEHAAGNINSQSRDRLIEKNATFLKEGAPATPYKINHDRITRSLDPGLMGSGISREIYGRAVKEYDQYVGANPQREGETPEQYGKRISDFAEEQIKRYQAFNTQELSISKPVPAHTAFSRGDMTGLPKTEATKKIAAANADLSRKFAEGQITEEQYNRDAVVLMDWLNFVQTRKDPEPVRK